MIDAEQLEQQIAAVREHLTYLESLRPAPIKDVTSDTLRRLLHSSKWPTAIEARYLCDPNSDAEKTRRGEGVLNNIIDRRITYSDSFLDFGCGEGHVAWAASQMGWRFAAGYDPEPQGWCRYHSRANFFLSSDWDVVMSNGPYDIITVHDVIDHAEDDPIVLLARVRSAMSDDGRAYIRCHPWTSRHGCHGCRRFNRAYCHLVFSGEDLQSWGWDGIPTRRFDDPLETYRKSLKQTGFKIVSERIQTSEVEKFFSIPKIAKKIAVSEDVMKIEYVDYVVSPE